MDRFMKLDREDQRCLREKDFCKSGDLGRPLNYWAPHHKSKEIFQYFWRIEEKLFDAWFDAEWIIFVLCEADALK